MLGTGLYILPVGWARTGGASSGLPVATAPVSGDVKRNLLVWTQEAQQTSVWSHQGLTGVTADATTAPDGTTTADKALESATTDHHGPQQTYSPFSTGAFTGSIYVKQAERRYIGLSVYGTAGEGRSVLIDAQTGTVTGGATLGGIASSSYAIADAGSGWWRIAVTVALTQAFSRPTFQVFASDVAAPGAYTGTGTVSYAGTAGSGFHVWGAQLEAASSASAYQRVDASFPV